MVSQKVEICLKKKNPTPSTNIPLLSYRKSEQQDFSYQSDSDYTHKLSKNGHGCNIFSNLSSGQHYLLNDIKKFRQKWLVKKSKFVRRKKNPPRAQIFRYFCIESRNNNGSFI